jgi:hypothetical protein
MAIQTGVGRIIAYKKEVTFGTLPTNDASAKKLRRVSFGLGLKKDLIKSEEIRTDYQRPAGRHGMRKIEGPLAGELSLGTYADFIGSALRKDFAAVSALSGLTTVTATVGAPQFVRSGGSWISDGLRVGMVVRCTGWTTTGTNNNSTNFTIIALTALNMTVSEAVAAKAAGDTVIFTIPGKVSYVPTTGHTNQSYSFEDWAPDITQSLRYLGCKVSSFDVDMPPNDKASISFGFLGQDRVTPTPTAQYFTSATAAGTTQMQTGLSGALFVNGTAVAVVTALKMTVSGGAEVQGVVGAKISPDVFMGPVEVTGSMSVLWYAGTIDGFFDLETEVPMVIKLLDTTAATSDFMTITLPFVKVSGGDLADNQRAVIQSFDFSARVGPDTTLGYEATTIQVQDSLA